MAKVRGWVVFSLLVIDLVAKNGYFEEEFNEDMTRVNKYILLIILMTGNYWSVGQSLSCDCEALIRQYPVKADSIKPRRELADDIKKVRSIYESKSDFEIRHYVGRGITNGGHVTVISCKQNTLKARTFHYWVKLNHPSPDEKIKRVMIRKIKVNKAWNLVLEDLAKLHLFTLPDMDLLNPRMKKYAERNGKIVEHRILIADGTSFTIQIKSGTDIRSYGYSNPDSYYKFYDDVEELRMAGEISSYLSLNLKTKKPRRLKYTINKLFH